MTTTTTITDTAVAVDACRQLTLTGLAPALDELCDDANGRRISNSKFLTEALQIELDIRHEQPCARRVHEAKLPPVRTLDDFDLDANPNITPSTIALLRDGAFITNNEPVVLPGNSGTGKGHLLIGACLAAAENGLGRSRRGKGSSGEVAPRSTTAVRRRVRLRTIGVASLRMI